MASLRTQSGNLFFDFRYKGKRCREYTPLADTPKNRVAAKQVLDKLNRDLALGVFDYAKTFPASPRAREFSPGAAPAPVATDQLPVYSPTYIDPDARRPHAPARALSRALPTLSTFVETWFSESKVAWRATYAVTVRDILDNHLLAHFGNTAVNEITRAELLNFRATVAAKRGKRPGSTLSPVRINTIMLITKQVLEEAADRYEFTCPFVRIKPLKVPKSDIQPFTLEEVQRILKSVRPDFRTYFLVRFFTGMRTGEIDGLKWKYVDFDKRQILVRETVVRGEEEYTKTDASQREIQMNTLVYEALLAQRDLTRSRSEFVYCSPNGNVIDHANLTKRIWYPLLKLLGIPARRPYQTRHTAATLWLAAGENPEWIARQMGHANTEMLFTVYSRFVPNLTRRDGSAMEQLISPLFGATGATTPNAPGGTVAISPSASPSPSSSSPAHQSTPFIRSLRRNA